MLTCFREPHHLHLLLLLMFGFNSQQGEDGQFQGEIGNGADSLGEGQRSSPCNCFVMVQCIQPFQHTVPVKECVQNELSFSNDCTTLFLAHLGADDSPLATLRRADRLSKEENEVVSGLQLGGEGKWCHLYSLCAQWCLKTVILRAVTATVAQSPSQTSKDAPTAAVETAGRADSSSCGESRRPRNPSSSSICPLDHRRRRGGYC